MIRSTTTSFQSGYDVQINLSKIDTYHHLSYKKVKETAQTVEIQAFNKGNPQ